MDKYILYEGLQGLPLGQHVKVGVFQNEENGLCALLSYALEPLIRHGVKSPLEQHELFLLNNHSRKEVCSVRATNDRGDHWAISFDKSMSALCGMIGIYESSFSHNRDHSIQIASFDKDKEIVTFSAGYLALAHAALKQIDQQYSSTDSHQYLLELKGVCAATNRNGLFFQSEAHHFDNFPQAIATLLLKDHSLFCPTPEDIRNGLPCYYNASIAKQGDASPIVKLSKKTDGDHKCVLTTPLTIATLEQNSGFNLSGIEVYGPPSQELLLGKRDRFDNFRADKGLVLLRDSFFIDRTEQTAVPEQMHNYKVTIHYGVF